MKKLLILICLTLTFGITNFTFSQSSQEGLIGKWQLVGSSGGITGKGITIKNKTVIEFTSDCRYHHYEQDSLIRSNTYSLFKSKSNYGNQKDSGQIQLGKSPFKNSFTIDDNRLIIRQPYVDGFAFIYMKVPITKTQRN